MSYDAGNRLSSSITYKTAAIACPTDLYRHAMQPTHHRLNVLFNEEMNPYCDTSAAKSGCQQFVRVNLSSTILAYLYAGFISCQFPVCFSLTYAWSYRIM